MKVINELDPDGTGFTDSYYNGQLYLLKTPTVYGDWCNHPDVAEGLAH